MEPTQDGLLEELRAPRRENYEFFPSGWSFESFNDSQDLANNTFSSNPNYSSFLGFITSSPLNPTLSSPFNELYPFVNGFTPPPPPLIDHSSNDHHKINCILPVLPNQEDCQHPSTVDDASGIPVSNAGSCTGSERSRNKSKKIDGQPSKNLMAERRRRKRLNNRLSLLRSIVPKISKMDRTAILGDTIHYMKELSEKINKLKENDDDEETNNMDQMNLLGNFNELNMNDGTMRNYPKFDVERRDIDTRIEICCATKPGLLLSTVNKVEALELDIHQCVISCFSDFSLQASCSEAAEHRTMISTEEMKQALLRNAGYGGRYIYLEEI